MYLSIIIPCYNEENIIAENFKKVLGFLSKYDFDYEIIPVDDGSKDNTFSEMMKLSDTYECINPETYADNRGKGGAVKRGLEVAKGDYILFMDADLATELNAIDEFLREIQTNDMVIASRRHKKSKVPNPQGPLRKLMSNGCKYITKLIMGMPYTDTQCGFKGMKKDLAKLIASKQTLNGWAFDVEYLYIAHVNNYRIKEIPIIWSSDDTRQSKVSPLKSSISFFFELMKISKNKKKYIKN